MSDNIQGLPEGENTPQGASPPQGQPQQNAPQTPAEQTPQAQPDLAAIQAELSQLRTERDQLKQKSQHFQSQFDRLRHAIDPNAQQPQQDPLAPYVEMMKKKGYREQDARDVAEMMYGMVAPLYQQVNSQQAALQNQAAVDVALRNAFQSLNQPHLQNYLADPEIYRAVENDARQLAMSGQPFTAESLQQYALARAFQEGGFRQMQQRPQGQQPPPPQNIHPLNFNTMTGIPANFSAQPPRQQTAAPANDAVNEFRAEMARRMGKQA